MSPDPNHPRPDPTPTVPPPLPPPVNVRLSVIPEHECPYFPDRVARSRAFRVGRMPPEVYHVFMDAGFRRSGQIVYQPTCATCRACVPVRVPVGQFAPSKSQRRCERRNADLVVTVGEPRPTEEKFDLYRRYVRDRHQGEEPDVASFEEFLYASPVHTLEFAYRDVAGRLLAVGICDASAWSLSSVYFYFDPADQRRGLGTYGALREITYAREAGIPYYYLGFWIDGCRTMQYKRDFRPNELLHPDGVWR